MTNFDRFCLARFTRPEQPQEWCVLDTIGAVLSVIVIGAAVFL